MWCWWCCHPFENIPLKLPYGYDDRRDTFKTLGHFCSWSCMKTYALETYGINRGGIICGHIILMRKKMTGEGITKMVKPAPKRQRLQVFGGDLTIEKFRENTYSITEKHKKINEEEVQNTVIPVMSNTKKMYDIKNATGNNETLRLKRNKPLKREQNNLENVLGLVIKKST